MAPIDGSILLVSEICILDTTDVNVSKVQPSKANCLLVGVEPQRNKSPTISYKYLSENGISYVNAKYIFIIQSCSWTAEYTDYEIEGTHGSQPVLVSLIFCQIFSTRVP